MPEYHYKCNDCDCEFLITQSIKDDSLRQCPDCGDQALRRVLHAVPVVMLDNPKTIGGKADRNTSKLGHYEREEMFRQQEEKKDIARRMKASENLPDGMTSMRDEKNKRKAPFWREGRPFDHSLIRKTPDERLKYIKRGSTT